MNKIKFENLNEAVVKTSNSVDTERVYDVESNVRIFGENKVKSFDGGSVKKDGNIVCTFSKHQAGQLNANFQNVGDVMEQCAILQAINTFVLGVIEEVEKGTVFVLN
jgi:catabolite regulation protein CreA